MARCVLIPLPDRDFDVSEVDVAWKLLSEGGVEVLSPRHKGATVAADPTLLEGVIFGQLAAEPEPKRFYRELEQAPASSRWAGRRARSVTAYSRSRAVDPTRGRSLLHGRRTTCLINKYMEHLAYTT